MPRKRIDYNKVERLYKDGLSDQEIADQAGCSKISITKWRSKNRLDPNKSLLGQDIEFLHKRGNSDKCIAYVLETSVAYVKRFRKKYSLKENPDDGIFK